MRREEAGLALHRRIGRPEIRHVGDRDAAELERRVLVVDRPLFVVVDDARRLHLPQRRPLGVLLAGLAGGVGAALEDRRLALDALGARRGETGRGWRGRAGSMVCSTRSESMKPLLKSSVSSKRSPVMTAPFASVMRALPSREDAAALAVVDDPVGLQRPALVVELDVADGRDRVVVVVVDDLLRLDEQPVLALAAPARGASGRRSGCPGPRPNRSRRRTAAPPRSQMRRSSDPFPYPLPGGPLLRGPSSPVLLVQQSEGTEQTPDDRREPGRHRRADEARRRRGPPSARSRHRAGIRPRRHRAPSGATPPKRKNLKETEAATNTMATKSSGRASSTSCCRR